MTIVVLGALAFFVVSVLIVFKTINRPEPRPLFPFFAAYEWDGWPADDAEEEMLRAA